MMDNSLILAYLAVLVSYLVFGIGLLPLADERPPHIKRINDEYSRVSIQKKKWGVIYFLLFQIIAHVLYLLDVNGLFGWQSFGELRHFFIRYYNQITASMILLSSGLIIWLYHQTVSQSRDYENLLKKISKNESKKCKDKLHDLAAIGLFAESLYLKLGVMETARQIAEKGFSSNPLDTARWFLTVIRLTLSSRQLGDIQLFEQAIDIVTGMLQRLSELPEPKIKALTEALDKKRDALTATRVLALALKNIGSEALSEAANWEVGKLQEELLNAVRTMPEGQQAEMLYEFGGAALQGGHRDEALAFLNELQTRRPPEWRIYWPGLLARLAEDAEVGYRWAAQMARSRGFTDANLNTAQQNFIALDMNTAQAIARVRDALTPPPAKS